jgi:ketosteroid isomerase-like protein
MVILLSILAVGGAANPPGSESTLSSERAIVQSLGSMYSALAADDLAAFRKVTSADFYAFDLGKRFTGDELTGLIKKAHDSGKVYMWQVTEPQIHIDGLVAWVTYTNRGSIQDSSGKMDVSWLESAVLYKADGDWRVHFLHSTRVPVE